MASVEPQFERAPGDAALESALLAKVAAGDRDAFRRLYGLYHRRLHRFLMRFTRERGLAEEIINDTMLVVWQNAPEFRGEAQASTWILGIAYRRALKAIERNRVGTPQSEMLAAASLFEPDRIDALSRSAELGDWIDCALTQLSPEHRLVIELAYFLGLSGEEIAEVTSCPLATVKTRMFYGRERLRGILLALADPLAKSFRRRLHESLDV